MRVSFNYHRFLTITGRYFNHWVVGCVNKQTLNSKINACHERCFCVIYNDKQPTIQIFLDKDKHVSKHSRNIQTLAVEMLKVAKGIAQDIFLFTMELKLYLFWAQNYGS